MNNWPLYRSAAYLTGRGVTFGAPIVPQAATNQGVYSLCFALTRVQGGAAQDTNLDLIADGSLDHVFVGPMLEAVDAPESLLKQAVAKLKMGGHFVLLVKLGNDTPGVTTFTATGMDRLMSGLHHWRSKALYVKDGYCLSILKKVPGKRGIDAAPPVTQKRACIARYGALGDAIVMTPLIQQLAEDGYEVTINISPYCAPVFENNPYVSNVITQEKDLIPNVELGKYWNMWEQEYDKYINLSESIEGDLLQIEGRAKYFTTKAWRHEVGNKNYYDNTLARGGYPHVTGKNGTLYFTAAEERRAAKVFDAFPGKFVVLWALNGSSHHKVYPMMEPTLLEWFARHPDSRVITAGDYTAKLLEFPHPQLVPRAGQWSVRESLIACEHAQLVIGPETMLTNGAGCFDTPKIVLLSHSTKENLTKYFVNDYSLEPTEAPCWPCHQLHYSKESCPIGQMKDSDTGEVLGQAPICALSIAPNTLLAQMEKVYQQWKAKQ
jgi:ADP-heptose:LPS heptosyltransferase